MSSSSLRWWEWGWGGVGRRVGGCSFVLFCLFVCSLVCSFVVYCNLAIQVITFCRRGWCMLGVFVLVSFTSQGHEYQDL